MDHRDIERTTRELLQRVLQSPDRPEVATLMELLEPKIICQTLGIHYEEHPTIAHAFGPRRKIGGLLDRQTGKIAVSMEFPVETMRFTAAHEIGHWLMHPGEIMHRDMPIDTHTPGDSPATRIEETQADHFAACLLMPRKLVKQAFQARFGAPPVRFTEAVAFALCAHDPDSLLAVPADSLQRELALATCTHWGHYQFDSLAQHFKVSKKAMAIRLKELRLISWP